MLRLPLWRLVPGAFILLAATASVALTLGRSQGVALIGRPLDVVVQLALDAGADASALCVDAEVFYADTRVSAGRVSTQVESVNGAFAAVRVRSLAPVDEAVVKSQAKGSGRLGRDIAPVVVAG